MIFSTERHDKYTLIRLEVEKLDSNISPSLKSELVLINSDGAKNIIMDLSKTRYCDSSGLSAILVANRLCKNSNGKLIITGLQDAVKKLITISQLDTILKIAPSTEDAVNTLKLEEVEKN